MDDGHGYPSISDLVDEHYALLYRYAHRLTGSAADAEDVTQQTFLTAQRKLDQLRQPDHAKAWLFTIARHTYLKGLRTKNATATVSMETVAEPTEEPVLDGGIEAEELQDALGELPEEFRTTLILFYFDEFSYKQIAEQMDVPIGTVMSRLARGKQYLRRRLTARQPAGSES